MGANVTRELWKWGRTWGAWCCGWATVLLLSGAAWAQEPSSGTGSLDFWDEYPPALEEYNRVRARD